MWLCKGGEKGPVLSGEMLRLNFRLRDEKGMAVGVGNKGRDWGRKMCGNV